MSGRFGGWTTVVAAVACLVAVSVGYSLWSNAKLLNYYIFCWPSAAETAIWRTKLSLVHLIALANLALPLLAVACVRYQPRQAVRLAIAELVLMPAALAALILWHPLLPIPQ